MRNRVYSQQFQNCFSSLYFRVALVAFALLACCQTSRGALVAYWNFDETTGTNVFDTAGNLTKTNDGFFATGNETPARVPGRLGSAVGFTWQVANTPGSGRRVIVPYHTNLTLNGGFSVSYWYRMDAATPAGTFPGIMRIGSQGTTTGNNVGWGYFRTGNMTFKRGNNQPALFGAMSVGQWYHLAIRFDGNTTGVNTTAFLNGVPVNFSAVNGWSNVTATTIFEMGRMDTFDQATLDDLALWGGEAIPSAKLRSIYTVPTFLFVDYNLADMRTLWGVFDGTGTSNAVVKGNSWSYAATLPGSTNDGDAYILGGNMYVALGGAKGVSAPITVLSGRFSPGGIGLVGTLAPTSAFTLTNANLVFDLNKDATIGGTTNDLLDITGDLTIQSSTVTVDPLAPLLGGTYRLINYSGAKAGSLTISNTTRYSIALDESVTNQINASISGTNGNLRWNSTASGVWDLAISNWFNPDSSATDRFFQGDALVFDDSGAFTTNINVTAAVFPRSIIINSATRPYIFTGAEQIGGMSEGLVKNGATSLTLSTPNTFIGDVTVNAGVLRVGNASALGNTNGQTIIAAGAALDLAGVNPGLESVTIQGSGINGAGAVVNTGGALSGTGLRSRITLAGDTTFGGSARWDPVTGPMVGNGFKLTKVGNIEIAMTRLGNTGLGDIDIVQGTLTFQESTGMGDPTKTIVVSNNAALAFWANGTATFNKPIVMRPTSILRNATGGGTDVSTNYGTVQLNGDVNVQATANIALMSEVSGSGNLLKQNTGTLYLGGTNTYSGRTGISQGRLALLATGSINSSPRIDLSAGAFFDTSRVPGDYPLASGQVLAGNGTVAGSIMVPTGASVLPGSENVPGTLTVTNGLALSGGLVSYDVTSATTEGSGINDLINVAGNLDLTGTTTIRINPLGLLTVGNTYTLINYTGILSGTVANFVVDNVSRYTFGISNTTPNKITVTVLGGAAADLFWLGGAPGAESLWDLQTTENWSDTNGSPSKFFGGDQVIFDSFGFPTTVDLVGTLTPASIRIENDTDVIYTFQGTGKLSGNSSLSKRFAGFAAIVNSNINDYIGTTTIEGGTLQVGAGGPFGNLGSGPITNNAILAYNRSDTLTFTNVMVGNGTFAKLNTNVLVMSLNNSNYSGTLTATSGIVRPTITNALGNEVGGTLIGSGATLDINAVNLGAEVVTTSGTGFGGNGAVVNNGAGGQNNALRFLTLAGNTTVGGSQRWDVRAAPTAALSSGGSGYNLTKVGTAQVSLVGVTVDPTLGDINVQSGILSAELSTAAGDPTRTVTVSANATLQFLGRTVPWNKAHVLNGGRNILNASADTTMTGPITVNGSVFFENNGTSLTITDPIAGGGSLVKTGAAIVTLVGDNIYSGNTTNAVGVLQLGGGGASGSVLGSIRNNGTAVSIFRSDAVTFTNPISGAGGFYFRTAAGLNFAPPSPVTIPNTLSVGQTSYGLLILSNGLTATIANLFLGDSSGINGDTLQLGGAITVTNQMRVGHWPSAAVNTYTMAGGTLTLTGIPAGVPNPSGVAEVGGILYLGIDGTGIFTQTGGVASAHGIVLDGRGNTTGGGDGVDRFILNGGRFNVGPSAIKSGSLDANTSIAVLLGGGTLASSANWTSVLAMTLTGTNGSTVFDSGANSNVLRGTINGAGGLVKTGAGTLALTGTNGYLGGTVVSQGTLVVRGIQGGGVASVSVQDGTLTGDGVINDALDVVSGTLSPGPGIARLLVSSTVSLAGTTLMDIDKTGVVLTNDQVVASSPVTFGGILTVSATGAALAPGDTFKLFTAPSYLNAFTTMNLPTLTSNYVWDVSNLAVDGSIRVTQPIPRISVLRSGNSLQLSWSNGFSDFILQAQTNAYGAGIQSNNWFSVSNNTNSATLDIDTSNGSVFLRLIKP